MINRYFELLFEGKLKEAEQERILTIPDKLIKFIWLDENENDQKKFNSLSSDKIWFSHNRFLNDPYEFKGMVFNSQAFRDLGYPENNILKYQSILNFDDYGISCFSDNPVEYLPMWAYYTNNYKGFCIEYNIERKNCIHKIFYESERIKVASLIFQCIEESEKAKMTGDRSKIDRLFKILLNNLFIKSKFWEHEKEYRIVYPIDNDKGNNVFVGDLGLKTSRIIAGINCSENNTIKLNEISNKLGLGDCYKTRIHNEYYKLELYR